MKVTNCIFLRIWNKAVKHSGEKHTHTNIKQT